MHYIKQFLQVVEEITRFPFKGQMIISGETEIKNCDNTEKCFPYYMNILNIYKLKTVLKSATFTLS